MNKALQFDNLALNISETGHSATLYADNGRIVFEILIHGSLAESASSAVENKPIQKGRPNIFRGELYQLAPYEILSMETERIIEK